MSVSGWVTQVSGEGRVTSGGGPFQRIFAIIPVGITRAQTAAETVETLRSFDRNLEM